MSVATLIDLITSPKNDLNLNLGELAVSGNMSSPPNNMFEPSPKAPTVPFSATLIPNLKKFISILRKGTESFRFKSLTNNAVRLLNDEAFVWRPENSARGKEKKHLKRSRKWLQILMSFEPIHPYNNLRLLWDILHLVVILILLFVIPINVCFRIEIERPIKEGILTFLVIDLLLNFCTSYFTKGFIVKDLHTIVGHYLEGEFMTDLATILTYHIEFDGHWNFIRMVFLLRWSKIKRITQKIQEKSTINLKVHGSVLDLIDLMIFSLYILNIFACVWFYIANIEGSSSETWLSRNNLLNESMTGQYFWALYWSTVTIMTVGYGDICATNTREAIYSIFTVFFGCGLFAYFINSVGAIVQEITKEAQIFKTKLAVINKYMAKKGVHHNLQMKIREYLRFIWEEESTQNCEIEREIIEKLSKSLRSELIFESYGQILQKYPLFFANFSEKCLSELMYEIKEVRNIPEDSIFTENQKDECEIYFIMKGKVELYLLGSGSKSQQIQILTEGDCFGEIAFFTGLERLCSAKSNDFTTLFLIKRIDFLRVLGQNPEDYEKYCMIRDQLVNEGKMNSLQKKCFSCAAQDHIATKCPLIHFVPDRVKFVKRCIHDPGHRNRTWYARNAFKRPHALMNNKKVKIASKTISKISQYLLDREEDGNSFEFMPTLNETHPKITGDSRKQTPKSQRGKGYSLETFDNNEEKKSTKNDKKKLTKQLFFNEAEISDMYQDFMGRASGQNLLPSLPSLEFEYPSKKLNEIGTRPDNKRPSLKAMTLTPIKLTKPRVFLRSISIPSPPEIKEPSSPEKLPRAEEQPQSKEILSDNEKNGDDEFRRNFEKGADFKNYFSEGSLRKVVRHLQESMKVIRKNILLKGRTLKRLTAKKTSMVNSASNSHFKQKNNFDELARQQSFVRKLNKVVPVSFEKIKIGQPERVERKGRKSVNSSIFAKKSEGKFFSSPRKQKWTFYDVVNEVILNQELKRRLQSSKLKNSRKRSKIQF